jgi:hypothetical protein
MVCFLHWFVHETYYWNIVAANFPYAAGDGLVSLLVCT